MYFDLAMWPLVNGGRARRWLSLLLMMLIDWGRAQERASEGEKSPIIAQQIIPSPADPC